MREGLDGCRGLSRLNEISRVRAQLGPARSPFSQASELTMQPSKFNILTKIHADERYLLVNLLSG
ncbi:MAG TPA: hypothetical protein VF316_11860, partial [Polyangiaceae bacterium]